MGAGFVLMLVVDVKAEDPIECEAVLEAEVGDGLLSGFDGSVCGGDAAVEVVAFDVDGGREITFEGEIDGDGLARGEVDDFSCDGDEPCFVGACAGDVGSEFFWVEVLIFSCGKILQEDESDIGCPGVELVFGELKAE